MPNVSQIIDFIYYSSRSVKALLLCTLVAFAFACNGKGADSRQDPYAQNTKKDPKSEKDAPDGIEGDDSSKLTQIKLEQGTTHIQWAESGERACIQVDLLLKNNKDTEVKAAEDVEFTLKDASSLAQGVEHEFFEAFEEEDCQKSWDFQTHALTVGKGNSQKSFWIQMGLDDEVKLSATYSTENMESSLSIKPQDPRPPLPIDYGIFNLEPESEDEVIKLSDCFAMDFDITDSDIPSMDLVLEHQQSAGFLRVDADREDEFGDNVDGYFSWLKSVCEQNGSSEEESAHVIKGKFNGFVTRIPTHNGKIYKNAKLKIRQKIEGKKVATYAPVFLSMPLQRPFYAKFELEKSSVEPGECFTVKATAMKDGKPYTLQENEALDFSMGHPASSEWIEVYHNPDCTPVPSVTSYFGGIKSGSQSTVISSRISRPRRVKAESQTLRISASSLEKSDGNLIGKAIEEKKYRKNLQVAFQGQKDFEDLHSIELIMPSLGSDGHISKKYFQEGCMGLIEGGYFPKLVWDNLPEEATELAIRIIDVDARDFRHWWVYHIPVSIASIPESKGNQPLAALEGMQEVEGLLPSDFGNQDLGYQGPCPPYEHKYRVEIYAFSKPIDMNGDKKNYIEFLKALWTQAIGYGSLEFKAKP
ncbi:MAG: YbhB/YbcL family Raf kinase inhibitor-like protein [Bdellovibrionales bacterium]|nr:YbhB/YbcL family Raf kinase inhibitor-like protein [Bdellovibrionales bacterium]